MATTIEVSKQSVKQLLETGKEQKFVIPEYQRPYEWTDEHIQTLFDDLIEYTKSNTKNNTENNAENNAESKSENSTENKNESTYFLGSIVSYVNDSNEQEIIDGQQRITSLLLLLRALYFKLSTMTETKEVINFKRQIESALWEQDELTAEVDYNKPLIYSKVMGYEGNAIFANILTQGAVQEKAKDNYSLNFSQFKSLIEKFTQDEPELLFWFIRNVLNRAILLPITADSQDSALTIFSTLNDRGLALSDADIFKAKIYNHLVAQDKAEFIEQWRQLDEAATSANESIQKLFYYYMFYLRALENDRDTTTPGLRKYYSRNSFIKLYEDDIITKLNTSLNLWIATNKREEIDEETWTKNIEIKQVLDALSSYPNEFWKYPVVIYHLQHRKIANFEEMFLAFLRNLLAVLTARYILTPTINAVKRSILNINAEIINSPRPKFKFELVDENELKEKIKTPHINAVRVILKILAYSHQAEMLPTNWEIEHILPQKWENHFFPNIPDSEVKELVEHIGNKIPFEKKLNIIASNGYFAKKQESYAKSKIKILLDLSQKNKEWGLNEIRERDLRIYDELLSTLKKWGLNRVDDPEQEERPAVPTAEELQVIEELRKKGFIK